ncbi:class I SAM-dependent methyltransferase [Deinococcus radiomollis]|uniref:class I SAM-dependent methyltransferase n=1 Tax=Deinococcus radiomollis TaxID=468916 RepID=UPI003891B73A
MTTPEGEWHVAQARAKFPSSAADLLRARTLEDDYRHLAQALHSGQRVLDVGCGTGSMTAGMAQLVAPVTVLGVDSNPVLLAEARQMYTNTVNLSFEQRDVYTLGFDSVFGVVVAARVLQWLSRPAEAIRQMVAALAPGGRLFVLDYNHLKAELTPPPPPESGTFGSGIWRGGATRAWTILWPITCHRTFWTRVYETSKSSRSTRLSTGLIQTSSAVFGSGAKLLTPGGVRWWPTGTSPRLSGRLL